MAIVPVHRLVDLLGPWRRAGTSRDRLAASLRSLVLEGRLAVESRLPPERALGQALGVSRATVTGAYDQLRAQGYVANRQGAGSWVTLPAGHRPAPPDAVVGGTAVTVVVVAGAVAGGGS